MNQLTMNMKTNGKPKTYLIDTGDDYIETTRRPPDDNWLTTKDAAKVLSISIGSWASHIGPANGYREIRRIVRGSKGKPNAQGQGWLWYRRDLNSVNRIRRVGRLQLSHALRIFTLVKLGELNFLMQQGDDK